MAKVALCSDREGWDLYRWPEDASLICSPWYLRCRLLTRGLVSALTPSRSAFAGAISGRRLH